MFLTEIGKCDFLTEMYYYKNNKSRSLCQETQTKKSPKFLWNSFAVRTGLAIGLPLCLQRTLTPGHGESIYKKRRNLAVSSCGAYGTRTRDPLRDRQIF